MLRDPFEVTTRPAAIGRVVTATITLVCVLIVYDGWAQLRVVDVVLIILGPILAIFTSHVFSTTLVLQVELGRRPTPSEWLANARSESRFLLLAVPPLALLLLLDLATVSLDTSVRIVIWVEALSLAFWTGLAAWLVGMRGRPLVLAVLAGLVVASVIVILQVMLQPGRALEDGSALGATTGRHADAGRAAATPEGFVARNEVSPCRATSVCFSSASGSDSTPSTN